MFAVGLVFTHIHSFDRALRSKFWSSRWAFTHRWARTTPKKQLGLSHANRFEWQCVNTPADSLDTEAGSILSLANLW